MSHRKAERRTGRRSALVALALALFGCVLVQSAVAATPTPESATLCSGSLKHAKPTPDDPNLLSYKFNCSGGISAYTLIVFRKPNDFDTIDDFATNPLVVDPTGNPLSTVGLSCAGQIPGNGINCNAGAGGSIALTGLGRGHARHHRAVLREHPAGLARRHEAGPRGGGGTRGQRQHRRRGRTLQAAARREVPRRARQAEADDEEEGRGRRTRRRRPFAD